MDPTCGSGGLLLAAHDRLRELQPEDWDTRKSHQDLAEHLRGCDADAFAVEIARLSMLLHAMPAGNGWDVTQSDVLSMRLARQERPSIMVANPPWRNTNDQGGKRREIADAFLSWIIEATAENGFLAVIMPAGWLNSRNSRQAREQLRKNCDTFEIWRLPEGAFESAQMAPAVVFAQKTSTKASHGWLFRRIVRQGALQEFYSNGSAEEAVLTTPDSVEVSSFLSGPLTHEFQTRSNWPRLTQVANAVTGPQPNPGISPRPLTEANCLYLKQARSLEQFQSPAPSTLIPVTFPDDFQGKSGRGRQGIGKAKVLVSAARSPNNPWRLKVAIDKEGILVRNSLQMVLPLDERHVDVYGLMAFLGSMFASAWIDEHVADRNISTSDVLGIPIPTDAAVWEKLASLGRRLYESSKSSRSDIIRILDNEVWQAFAVSPSIRESVEERFSGFAAPEGGPRVSVEANEDSALGKVRRRFGAVERVKDGQLLLRVPGVTYDDGSWISPPKTFLGWLAREGRTFGVRVADGSGIECAKFQYHSRSWLTSEELYAPRDNQTGEVGTELES
jgi:hypothetical protein